MVEKVLEKAKEEKEKEELKNWQVALKN